MNTKPLILIDGSSYFFRAFYAIPRLSTSKGLPTNALFGFINMLLKVLDTEKPERLAIVFDSASPTFRKERYSEYKSNRSAPPEDLVVQIPLIFRAVDCFRIPRFEMPGFEADDIIATLAEQAKARGETVEVITGDKDLMQLVDDSIVLFDTMKDRRIDRNGVRERFGVEPHQIVDLLALMGDSSSSILELWEGSPDVHETLSPSFSLRLWMKTLKHSRWSMHIFATLPAPTISTTFRKI